MTKPKKAPAKRPIDRYEHKDKKRVNNPQVGLVTPETDPVAPTHATYDYVAPVPSVKPKQELDYDPHLDPQLVWAGKKEHSSFEVPTVSLHVHERIDPYTIIKAVRKKNGNGLPVQPSLFERPEEHRPLREEIDFYKHPHGWSNRLIAGDSLLVMNSLLQKEGMAGQVQMVYVDPPYGIKYGSNFQPFVNKRNVTDGRDEDLTQEPEMIRAFRDTWELGIHSYLTYLRDRLVLARDLLSPTGSIFIQIGDQNVHHVRELLDGTFGAENFVAQINFKSMQALGQSGLAKVYDYILWYASNRESMKFRSLFIPKDVKQEREYRFLDDPQSPTGLKKISEEEFRSLEDYSNLFRRSALTSSGFTPTCTFSFQLDGVECKPFGGKSWRTNREGIEVLKSKKRLFTLSGSPYYKLYYEDFPYIPLENSWREQAAAESRLYVVQTGTKFIQRCMLMSTDPGDIVFDPTCGSAATAYVAEQWGRRWITCDTSRVAITLAKQRLMSAVFEYYELRHPDEGIGSGLQYRKVPHVTLKSVAHNEPPDEETLYDQPATDASKMRVSGPFTVEAVPAPTVRSLDDVEDGHNQPADSSISRTGTTLRHSEWRDELLKTGLRGKSGNQINFSRVEPLAGTRWLHADAETKGVKPERVVISFGPEHSLLEQRQVELAWEEARTLIPKPAMIVFAAFEFDPEAAKDIDELTKEKTGMTFLTAQMNADLLTEDLKKKRASNQSFWLVGRPDVDLRQIKSGEHKGKWEVEVNGFDYYNTRTGTIDSGDTSKIAMWLLDTDYDGRSLYPRQVFFPMAGDDEGWAKMARNLKAEIDPELLEQYRKTVSLPFEPGEYKRIGVKVIDDRGIESLKIVELK